MRFFDSHGVVHIVDEKTGLAAWIIARNEQMTREEVVAALLRIVNQIAPEPTVVSASPHISVPPRLITVGKRRINPALLDKGVGELKLCQKAERFVRVDLQADCIGELIAWREADAKKEGEDSGHPTTVVEAWLAEIKAKLELRGLELGHQPSGWQRP